MFTVPQRGLCLGDFDSENISQRIIAKRSIERN